MDLLCDPRGESASLRCLIFVTRPLFVICLAKASVPWQWEATLGHRSRLEPILYYTILYTFCWCTCAGRLHVFNPWYAHFLFQPIVGNVMSAPGTYTGRNKRPNRRPNRTEPFNSGTGRNRTRNWTKPKWTEPRLVWKTLAEPRRTVKHDIPNRTEPNRLLPAIIIHRTSRL